MGSSGATFEVADCDLKDAPLSGYELGAHNRRELRCEVFADAVRRLTSDHPLNASCLHASRASCGASPARRGTSP
jgi:hypothetical protein